jgi:hypothetical protein
MARGEDGRRFAHFLGEHGTAATERAYRQFLADFYGGHPIRQPQPHGPAGPGKVAVEHVCSGFLLHAEFRYRHEDGTPTNEAANFAHAFRHLLLLYRDIAAEKFDVTMLEAVQRPWSATGCPGGS